MRTITLTEDEFIDICRDILGYDFERVNRKAWSTYSDGTTDAFRLRRNYLAAHAFKDSSYAIAHSADFKHVTLVFAFENDFVKWSLKHA